MSKYRKIDPRIWNDAKFNSLSLQAKLAFIFMLTHPNLTSLGAMRTTINGLVAELNGVSEKAFKEVLSKGLFKVDNANCILWFPNFLRYNRPESPNVVKNWVTSLDLIPECPLKVEMLELTKGFLEGLDEAFQKAWGNPSVKTMLNQEQEQEQEQKEERVLSDSALEIGKSFYEYANAKFKGLGIKLGQQQEYAQVLIDKYGLDDTLIVIDNLKADDFFSKNIRSLKKLDEHWATRGRKWFLEVLDSKPKLPRKYPYTENGITYLSEHYKTDQNGRLL